MQPLHHPVFRWLFTAQVLSLLGVGTMTVALALQAFSFGGLEYAGKILGGMFALKMVVYVGLAPLAEVALSRYSPRHVLTALDLVRLCLLLMLGFATEVWHLVGLTCLFFSASAAFTPLYQATIPSVLTDEKTYTAALVLSRLAYTFESMLSPAIAAIALSVVAPASLFPVAAFCMAGSVLALNVSGLSASAEPSKKRPFKERLSRGLVIYFRTPRLRGLFVLNLALSFGLGWVLVNTVVYIGVYFEGSSVHYTYLMCAFGAGSAAAALSIPRWLGLTNERNIMFAGCVLFSSLSMFIFIELPFFLLLLLWAGFGAASSLVLTPGGLVLTRSAAKVDHPAVFAAQFSMSHAGWLAAYPVAGMLGSSMDPDPALGLLGGVCLLFALLGFRIWPAVDPKERVHAHPDLPADHPHFRDHLPDSNSREHSHVFHIDELHLKWDR
ncbi:MAG: MFS transporter [Granulosicoccus sp.]